MCHSHPHTWVSVKVSHNTAIDLVFALQGSIEHTWEFSSGPGGLLFDKSPTAMHAATPCSVHCATQVAHMRHITHDRKQRKVGGALFMILNHQTKTNSCSCSISLDVRGMPTSSFTVGSNLLASALLRSSLPPPSSKWMSCCGKGMSQASHAGKTYPQHLPCCNST